MWLLQKDSDQTGNSLNVDHADLSSVADKHSYNGLKHVFHIV